MKVLAEKVLRRGRLRTVSLAILLMFASKAQCQPQPRQPSGASSSTLEGTVVNSVTGEPIPHALVQLVLNRQAVLSDVDGGFHFKGLREGEDVIVGYKPGFFPEPGADEENTPNRVTIGQHTRSITFKLSPEALLTGHVEDSDHDPLSSAYIWLSTIRVEEGRRRYQTVSETRSDEDGNFRIPDLMAGEYIAGVGPEFDTPSQQARSPRQGDAGFAPVFYPGVGDIEAALPTKVKAGQRAELGFVFRPQPVFQVSGRVVAGPYRIPTIIWIGRPSVPGYFRRAGVNPATGEFQVRYLPAGDYVVRADSEDGGVKNYGAQSIAVYGDIEDLQLPVGPGVTIPVVTGGSVAARDADDETEDASEEGTVRIRLIPDEWWGNSVEGNDRFNPELAGVGPGRYTVEITTSKKKQRIQSARYGTTDLLQEKLVITTGAAALPIEISLRDDAGRIEVSVPPPGKGSYHAVVLPDSLPMAAALAEESRGSSTVVFESLAPGDYKVFVFENIDGIPYSDREFMRRYESKATRVSVPENGNVSVHPEVTR